MKTILYLLSLLAILNFSACVTEGELVVTNGTGSGVYSIGLAVPISSNPPADGFRFYQWDGTGATYVTDRFLTQTTVKVNRQLVEIEATYLSVDEKYLVTVIQGSGNGNFMPGEFVTIKANAPGPNLIFDKWRGDTSVLTKNPDVPEQSFRMPRNEIELEATYRDDNIFKLTVDGGTGSGNFEGGTLVTIKGTSPGNQYVFQKWTGDTQFLSNINNVEQTFTMPSQDVYVKANYVQQTGLKCSTNYCFRELATIPRYLWHMACYNNEIFSGTYGDPVNSFYKIKSDGSFQNFDIDSGGESTRVYNLNNKFFSTSEGGKIFMDNAVKANLGGHYVLAAASFNGLSLIARSPRSNDSSNELWNCQGGICALWKMVPNIRTYHLLQYNGDLVMMGREPKGSGGYNTAHARVFSLNKGFLLAENTNGIAVRGTVFDNKLFVGITNNARVKSYNGVSWTDEISFPAFHHLGDLIEYNNQLFVVAVRDGGNPEVWSRGKTSGWSKVFDTTMLAKYGVNTAISNVVLNNAAGFFTNCNGKLYMNINTPTNNRTGPGFILEITPK